MSTTEAVLCPPCFHGDHAHHAREWGPGKVCPCPGCFRRPQDAPGGPGSPVPTQEHTFTSTACQHALHGRCQRFCEFCPAQCVCPCHPPIEEDR